MIHSLRHRSGRGEGKIGCIFWTAALALFAYVAFQWVPVKMKSIDLEQFIVRQAESASIQARNTERQLKANILAQADELDLPLVADNLTIQRSGARIKVTATYTVPIDLLVTEYQWVITHSVERRMLRL